MNTLNDIKYAFRLMLKNPKFTALTVFVMTTGLTLCIYMFSFINGTLTADLPFEGGDRIKKVSTIVNGVKYGGASIRVHEYEEMKVRQQSFEVFDAFQVGTANVSTSDKSMRYRGHFVSPEFFEISEGKAILGRLISDNDLLPGAEKVTVLGYEMWQSLFAGNTDVIGKKIRVNSVPHTLVGVTQEGYKFPAASTIFMPYNATSKGVQREKAQYVGVYGRVKPGISDEAVLAEINQFFKEFESLYPKLYSNTSGNIWSFQEEAMGDGTSVIVFMMQLSVALILLLACINVGNLLLSRAFEKNKETAIRTALGAPRSRLVSQLMWESFLICFTSGVLSILFAGWWLELSFSQLIDGLPIPAPFWWTMGLNTSSLIIAALITLATAIITGILPAWKATKGDFNAVLRDGTRGAQSKNSGRLSKIIVGTEVALSCALLILSTSLVVSVKNINDTDYGMNIDGYLTARIGLPEVNYKEPEKRILYYQALAQKLKTDDAVEGVAFSNALPSTWGNAQNMMLEGVDYGKKPQHPSANWVTISNDFFNVMDIKLIEGRGFDSRDKINTPLTAVVTQNFIDNHFPGQTVLGKRFKFVEGQGQWVTIVGVVNDVIFGQPFAYNKSRSTAFLSMNQDGKRFMSVAIKAKGDANDLRTLLADTSLKLERDAPPYSVMTLREGVLQRVGGMNFVSEIFMVFAIASMILAFSGIYGVMSNSIVQKTQEIGVRRALGADNFEIFKHFLKQASIQLLGGLIIGLPIGVALVQLLSGSGLVEANNIVFVLVPAFITLIILIAVIAPVARALKIEPCSALRYE